MSVLTRSRITLATLLAALLPAVSSAQPCAVPSVDDTVRVAMPGVGLQGPKDRLVVADLDRDGAADLVFHEFVTETLWVTYGRRDRDFRAPHLLATPPIRALHAALGLSGPGRTDLLVETDLGPAFLVGDGSGGVRVVPATGIDAALPPERWRFADLDGDGRTDVVAFSGGAQPSLETFLGDGTGAFRHAGSTSLAGVTVPYSGSVGLVLGDADGDGRPDAVVSSLVTVVLHGDGRGGFERPVKVLDGFSSVDIGDLDHDGHPDLLVRTTAGYGWEATVTASVAWGDGAGGFSAPVPVVTGVQQGRFTLADLDGDGRPDVVGSGLYLPLTAWRLASGRTFGPQVELSRSWAGMQAVVSAVADVDGDGRDDLVGAASWPYPIPVLVNRCDGSTFARTVVVPAVVSVRGVGDTLYSSELVLTNRGADDVRVELTYTAAAGGGSGRASLVLPAGRQRVLPDAIDALRQLGVPIPGGPGRVGSLRVRFSGAASPADVSVLSRVSSPYARGEVSVGVEPVPLLEGLTGPSIVPLLREDDLDRTNLALVSLAGEGEGDVTLRIHVFPTDGVHVDPWALPDVRLAPGAFVQLDRVLASTGGMASGWVRIHRVGGDAPYAAYAVINDNASGDGSVLAAVPDLPTVAPNASVVPGLFVPAVPETDRFSTELVLTNTTDYPRTAHVVFSSPALGTSSHQAARDVAVPPGQQVSIPAFARSLCEASPGPAVPCAGALTVQTDQGGLHAVTRTLATAGAGRFGLAVEGRPTPMPLRATCWLDGLRQDDAHRTNLGLVNLDPYPSHHRLEIFDGDTGRLVATLPDLALDAGGWLQLGEVLAAHAPGVSNGYARLTHTGDWSFGNVLGYAVLNDGAGAGLGNGDGALLPMRYVPR